MEDVIWIRLFNILYRKHKSWMSQRGTPPTWEREKAREGEKMVVFQVQIRQKSVPGFPCLEPAVYMGCCYCAAGGQPSFFCR